MFGSSARYEQRKVAAQQRFAHAMDEHKKVEDARQQRVAAARREHAAELDAARKAVAQQHTSVDTYKQKVLDGDRHATSDYYQRLLDSVAVPSGFPTKRRAAYVPESRLLAIEWELPGVHIVPAEKEFAYVKTRDVLEVRKSRSVGEVRATYQNVVAQLALKALHITFNSDPGQLVDTVVFNGVVDEIDRATGQPIRPCLITLRATRDHFAGVNLNLVDPIQCV